MVRVFTLFLLALLAISMLHTIVLASHGHGGHHYDQRNYGPGVSRASNARHVAQEVQQDTTRKPCTFFVRSATKMHSLWYYGNKVVASYNNWKAKEGGPKCPLVVTLFTLLTHFKLAHLIALILSNFYVSDLSNLILKS
ncbi:hypothetical protein AAG906_016733 [Vitis piasezkii]